jgi:nicotinamidase-related amidase
MSHQNTLLLETSALIIIDMQEAFREKIPDFTEIALRIGVLTRAATLLDLPVLITEQYPKGLGHTAMEIREVLPPNSEIIEKTTFSSCGIKPFREQLKRSAAKQVLVCGIEAHICVNQTVHDLLADGYQVHLVTECVSSRDSRNRMAGLAKMQMSGAVPSSVELALFELIRDAKHDKFKAIQQLVK